MLLYLDSTGEPEADPTAKADGPSRRGQAPANREPHSLGGRVANANISCCRGLLAVAEPGQTSEPEGELKDVVPRAGVHSSLTVIFTIRGNYTPEQSLSPCDLLLYSTILPVRRSRIPL